VLLGLEMGSTDEMMGLGGTFPGGTAKDQIAAGIPPTTTGPVLVSSRDSEGREGRGPAIQLHDEGPMSWLARKPRALRARGIPAETGLKVRAPCQSGLQNCSLQAQTRPKEGLGTVYGYG